MKQIYLIRHGQTEYNRKHIVQGSGVDSNLNAVGQAQGEAFFQRYQHVPFDKVYTSKLRRTHQTVARFIGKGIEWEQLEGLNEICWGIKEGKHLTAADDKQHFAMLEAWKQGDYTAKVVEGESPIDVVERQKVAWSHIMSKHEDERVLVCMHGRAMRILLCYLLNEPLSNMDSFEHTNTCLYLLEYNEATASYTLCDRNNVQHLNGIDWNHIADVAQQRVV